VTHTLSGEREIPMENYDIRYDDKYGQLTHIDLAALVRLIRTA
jgi:hypothetical protein